MASARKPVIVRKFTRDWCAGYAGPELGRNGAELEILDLAGKVIRMVIRVPAPSAANRVSTQLSGVGSGRCIRSTWTMRL